MITSQGLHLLALLSVVGTTIVRSEEYDYFKYHPVAEISDWMFQMAKMYPDMVTIQEYGKTYQLRPIRLLKIGMKSEAKKKAIWMDCGIHAREWIAPAFCQYFVKQLLQAYNTDPKVKEMMSNMDFYVTPVLNMDGYFHSWRDNQTRLWRKNMSPGPPGCNCTGTDLNRNFDASWGTLGTSHDCCQITYCGREAASEQEAQAVTYFVGSRREDFLCFFTIHSYGQMLLVPYGQPNNTDPNYNELMKVGTGAAEAIKKVHGKSYTVGTPHDILYAYSGSSRDWARHQGIPFSYTFELRDNGTFGFKLPEDQIKPTCEEAYSGVLHIVTYAHDKTFNGATRTTAAFLSTLVLAIGVIQTSG
ncbi:carboxypeptidase O-like [Neosynchiropus ocellatus]